MIPTKDTGSIRYESMGYVQFCSQIDDDRTFSAWFSRLRNDVDLVDASDADGQSRLVALQNCLMDLIEFLDPRRLRLPGESRKRLTAGPASGWLKRQRERNAENGAAGNESPGPQPDT